MISKLYNKAAPKVGDCDAVASVQTAEICRDVLGISRIFGKRRQPRSGSENSDQFAKVRSMFKRKLVSKKDKQILF
jgi:hypothetical protein